MRIEYFQLIDRIVALDVSAWTIRVEAVVPRESTIFEGHFPGNPLMPGVLLIESMAQTAGWLVIALTRFERMPFLAAIKDAKLLHDGSGFAITKASIAADGKPICDAEITFRVMPFPEKSMRRAMEETAARIGFPMQALADG